MRAAFDNRELRKQALVVEGLEVFRRVGNLRRAGAQALGKELWRCMMLSVHSELNAVVQSGRVKCESHPCLSPQPAWCCLHARPSFLMMRGR
jgi:hypothetical protein